MGSVFTSKVTETVAIAHDPGQSVVIRKLAPRDLEVAQQSQSRRSLANLRELGDPAFLQGVRSFSGEDKPTEKAERPTDPLAGYDPLVLLAKGVVSWTYEEALDAKSIADLDDETLDLIARAILRLSKPRLFQTPEQVEEARKNG
jgi:hypothetical protein